MLNLKQLTADIPHGLIDLLDNNGVRFLPEVKLEEIAAEGVIAIDKTWKHIVLPADTVVLSLGFKSRTDIANSFCDKAPDAFLIGDCRKPKDLKQAIHDGFNIAVEI
jgi:hypothetical protein